MRVSGPAIVHLSLCIAVGGIAVASSPSPQNFVQALLASGRHESIPAEMDIYKPLIGDWRIIGKEYSDGVPKSVEMTVTFVRALDGRAIQDVWNWPIDASLPATGANRAGGTTLRVYDPVERVWQVTWIDPLARNRVQLEGRKVGENLVHLGATAVGVPRRWIFSGIRQESFTWRGEISNDGGQTWFLSAEYFAKRQ